MFLTPDSSINLRSLVAESHRLSPQQCWLITREITRLMNSLHEAKMCFAKLDLSSVHLHDWTPGSLVNIHK